MRTPEELKIPHDELQVGLSEDEICIREGIILNIQTEAKYGFEFFCWRSPEMVLEMDYFIKYAKGKRRMLDIGASYGIFSMVFAEINKDSLVCAFEPCNDVFKILRQNKNIYSFMAALSDKEGGLTMHKEWDHLVSGSSDSETDTKISCIKGDVFCRLNMDSSVDTMKIDVEGMEVKVLRGLKETIKENHPIIFLEIHPERIIKEGDSIQELIDMLANWRYLAIDTKTNKPITFEEIAKIKEGEIRLVLI